MLLCTGLILLTFIMKSLKALECLRLQEFFLHIRRKSNCEHLLVYCLLDVLCPMMSKLMSLTYGLSTSCPRDGSMTYPAKPAITHMVSRTLLSAMYTRGIFTQGI